MNRSIIFFGDQIVDFYQSQEEKIRIKIDFVLDLVRFERQVPAKFFKKLENTGGIYEVRVITPFKNIRLLCFLDGNQLIVLTNGFLKKTQQTPKSEIRLAQRLRDKYILQKNGNP